MSEFSLCSRTMQKRQVAKFTPCSTAGCQYLSDSSPSVGLPCFVSRNLVFTIGTAHDFPTYGS